MTGVFDRVTGQEHVVAGLRAAAEDARRGVGGSQMVHSWLFTGPPGSGRSVAARAFAAALQCQDPEIVGCGHCRACTTVLSGTHADVQVLAPDGVNILLRQVRETIRRAAGRPATGRFQIVVIEDADRLTEQSGNALLKVVEEPPARTVFLLCAPTTEDVMVTLRSRARQVYLRQPSTAAVAAVLEAEGVADAETVRWAASVSSGHVGRARWLAVDEPTRRRRAAVLDLPMVMHNPARAYTVADTLVVDAEEQAAAQRAEADEREVDELRTALGAGGSGKGTAAAGRGATGAVRELERTQKSRRTRAMRDSLDLSLIDLAGFYRDALMAGLHAEAVPAVHPDVAAATSRLGGHYPPADVLRAIDAVQDCRAALAAGVTPRFALAAMVGAVRRALRIDAA